MHLYVHLKIIEKNNDIDFTIKCTCPSVRPDLYTCHDVATAATQLIHMIIRRRERERETVAGGRVHMPTSGETDVERLNRTTEKSSYDIHSASSIVRRVFFPLSPRLILSFQRARIIFMRVGKRVRATGVGIYA